VDKCHFVTKNITVNCLLLVIIYLTYITDVSWHGTNVIDEDGYDTCTELKIFIEMNSLKNSELNSFLSGE
jgi:hypothetical protein